MTDMYKVNLSGIKTPPPPNKNPKVDTIQIGEYLLTSLGEGNESLLTILDADNKEVVEISKNDVLIHGKSIDAIWKTLENHYEALKVLLKHE